MFLFLIASARAGPIALVRNILESLTSISDTNPYPPRTPSTVGAWLSQYWTAASYQTGVLSSSFSAFLDFLAGAGRETACHNSSGVS